MAEAVRFSVDQVALTRVEYFDVGLDPTAVSLDAQQVAAVPWAVPTWATADGQVLVGQAMWVLESGGVTIVVDPCGASDAFLRSGPEAIDHQEAMLGALADAGFAADAIDVVLLSHLDGIGLVAVVDEAGCWRPAFPRARVVLTAEHLGYLAEADPDDIAGYEAFGAVQAAGVVDGVDDGHEVAPGITVEVTGAHVPGHAVIRIGGRDDHAVLVGHLAVSPLHATTGPCAGLNLDPAEAWTTLRTLMAEAAERDAVLIGPLWPRPGAGRVSMVEGTATITPTRA